MLKIKWKKPVVRRKLTIQERSLNGEKCLGRQGGMRSKVLYPREVTVLLSPCILLSLWQKTDAIGGFTELLVSRGLAAPVLASGWILLAWGGSCEHARAVHFCRELSGPERVSSPTFPVSTLVLQTGPPEFPVLCALTCPHRDNLKKSVLAFLFLFSSAELFGSTEILF